MDAANNPQQAGRQFRSMLDYLNYHGWFLGAEYEGAGLMAVAAISAYRDRIPQAVVNAAATHENARIRLAILSRADVMIPAEMLNQALSSVQPAIQIAAIARHDAPLDTLEYLNMVSVERDPAVALALLTRQSGSGSVDGNHDAALPLPYQNAGPTMRQAVEPRDDLPVE